MEKVTLFRSFVTPVLLRFNLHKGNLQNKLITNTEYYDLIILHDIYVERGNRGGRREFGKRRKL